MMEDFVVVVGDALEGRRNERLHHCSKKATMAAAASSDEGQTLIYDTRRTRPLFSSSCCFTRFTCLDTAIQNFKLVHRKLD